MAWSQSTSMWRTTSRSHWSSDLLGVFQPAPPGIGWPLNRLSYCYSKVYLYTFNGVKPILNWSFGILFATAKTRWFGRWFLEGFITWCVGYLSRMGWNDPGFHSRFRQRQYSSWSSCGCPGGCLGIVAGPPHKTPGATSGFSTNKKDRIELGIQLENHRGFGESDTVHR